MTHSNIGCDNWDPSVEHELSYEHLHHEHKTEKDLGLQHPTA